MIRLLSEVPQYRLFRGIGLPKKLPLNVTLSVTYACNSRCKTCNIWRNKVDNLSLEELDCVFRSLGRAPYWFTISGGEPFLREDLADICRRIYHNCRPGIINIATNGLLAKKIPETVAIIAESCTKSRIVVNVSLDGIGAKHDEIRGVPGNWDKATATYAAMRQLRHPNLELGIHTVISRFNVDSIPDICDYVATKLKPDSHITEIAEERVELATVGCSITPSAKEYADAVDSLLGQMQCRRFSGLSKITQAFRVQYYDMAKETLVQKKQMIPCYAGFASAQIAPDGAVWTCCIKAEPIGSLRDVGYDFSRVWFSTKAAEMRRGIKAGECYCPLANASYTNMLMHPWTLARVARVLLTS